MQFAPQQDEALKAVSKWLKEGKSPVFRLFGYAGTGKTTLAKHFAEHVDGDVLFAAFTGKAAQVLRSRGASNRGRAGPRRALRPSRRDRAEVRHG